MPYQIVEIDYSVIEPLFFPEPLIDVNILEKVVGEGKDYDTHSVVFKHNGAIYKAVMFVHRTKPETTQKEFSKNSTYPCFVCEEMHHVTYRLRLEGEE